MAGTPERIELEVGDRVVKISNPHRIYFSARGETKPMATPSHNHATEVPRHVDLRKSISCRLTISGCSS